MRVVVDTNALTSCIRPVLAANGIRVVRIRNSDVSEANLRTLIQPFVPPLRVCGEGEGG